MSDCCSNCGGVLKPGGCCGCSSNIAGTPGNDGVDGASAYDIWISEGNVGTEQDFLDSLVGPAGADGTDGTPSPKASFYSEFIGQVNVSDGLPDPAVYHFPTGYGVNTYTNSSGATKDYIVHGSFDSLLFSSNLNDVENWVDGAIIKTVAAVDSVEWESTGLVDLSVALYDGPDISDNIYRASLPDTVNTTPGDNPVEVRFTSANIPRNVAFFKKVTLNDGESVSLKFKTKENLTPSILKQAQFFVLELD